MVILIETMIMLFLATLVYNASGMSKSFILTILVVGFLVMPTTLKVMMILIGMVYFVIHTISTE